VHLYGIWGIEKHFFLGDFNGRRMKSPCPLKKFIYKCIQIDSYEKNVSGTGRR